MALLHLPGGLANAQSVQHLCIPQPGGMPGWPVMTGVKAATNGVSVTWDGPSGYYQLYQRQSQKNASWQAVGGASLLRSATVAMAPSSSSSIFRVAGPSAVYGGYGLCAECHQSTINVWINTKHAQAFDAAQATNDAYFYSHTVGFKAPTGFVSAAATPELEGVQCENCHGPAANHAANFYDVTALPRIELAATVCGGCHTGPQQPIYDEWTTSGHAQVPGQSGIPDMNPASRIDACGRCHSGSARLSLLNAEPLPIGDADMPVMCVVCHDPHAKHSFTNVLNGVYTFTNKLTGGATVISNTQLGAVYTGQFRNPLGSTNNYSLAGGAFASQYKTHTNVNLCAQCHNDRGASYTDSTYPPHHSVQYNMLLGTVGVLTNTASPNLPGTHSQLELQCVACHMQTAPYQSAAKPAVTGHNFAVQLYNVCTPCHDGRGPGLVQFMSGLVSNRVAQVKGSLDFWATTKAPAILGTAIYGTRAWEYVNPGSLSSGGPGPASALQAKIPVNIQKARFNLYLVNNDGSGGVHNPFYVLELLNTADAWVKGEQSKPSP